MKRARELVLMNLGGSIQPEEQLDVEFWTIEDDELRLAKSRAGLMGLVLLEEKLFDKLIQIQVFGRRIFLHGLPGEIGKGGQGEVLPLPAS